MYAVLADLVLLLHFALIIFGVFGGFLVLRRPWLAWLQLPLAIWDAFVEFSGLICPLTPLENRFRALAGQTPYTGNFIDHYLTRIIYPEGLTRGMQFALGAAVFVLNGVLYWRLITRRR